MANPFIGEIRIFAGNFAPDGWFFCTGQSLNVMQYQALYAVIGNTYGGTPGQTFNLPDLRASAPLGQGSAPGLTPRTLGQPCGTAAVTLADSQMVPHTHAAQGSNAVANSNDPTNRIWAKVVSTPQLQPYGKTVASAPLVMNGSALSAVGGGGGHSNLQPYQGINFIMAWSGEFPVRE